MTQLKKALGYTRAASDPGDGRRVALLSAAPLSSRQLGSFRCSPNGFHRYQLSTSAGFLSGDMRPFLDNVPATASAALGRFGEERCFMQDNPDRTLSPVWGTGSSYRRTSVNLDDDFSKLSASERSKTSLGHRSSLSKYTPLPAIGSSVHREELEAENADEPCGSDGAESFHSRNADDNDNCDNEEADPEDKEESGSESGGDGAESFHSHNADDNDNCDNEEADPEDKEESGSESGGSESHEVADDHISDEVEQESDEPQPEVDEGKEQQQQDASSATESAAGDSRPPLVRSRTFTVLKVDDPCEGEGAGEGDRASKKGGIAFFIGGADDGDCEEPAESTGEDRDNPAN